MVQFTTINIYFLKVVNAMLSKVECARQLIFQETNIKTLIYISIIWWKIKLDVIDIYISILMGQRLVGTYHMELAGLGWRAWQDMLMYILPCNVIHTYSLLCGFIHYLFLIKLIPIKWILHSPLSRDSRPWFQLPLVTHDLKILNKNVRKEKSVNFELHAILSVVIEGFCAIWLTLLVCLCCRCCRHFVPN